MDAVCNLRERLHASGFRVILDLHFIAETRGQSTSNGKYSAFLEVDNAQQAAINFQAWQRAWRIFIQQVESQKSVGGIVAYELFNEYVGERNVDLYYAKLVELTRQIRSRWTNAPIIVAGHQWASLDQLERVVLAFSANERRDPNLFANFHFYEPFEFTHEAASWVGPAPDGWSGVGCLPYPFSQAEGTALFARGELSCPKMDATVATSVDLRNPVVSSVIQQYAAKNPNHSALINRLQIATQLRTTHGINLIDTEFGAARGWVTPLAIRTYTKDIISAFKESDIDWVIYFGPRFNKWWDGTKYVPQLFTDTAQSFTANSPIESSFVTAFREAIRTPAP